MDQPSPVPALPVYVYAAGSLAGEPMTIRQIVESLHSGHATPAARAVIHVIESYATEATALAHSENAIREGMADKYLMASGFLANILVDLREYAAGRMPAMPVQERLRPRRPDPEKS